MMFSSNTQTKCLLRQRTIVYGLLVSLLVQAAMAMHAGPNSNNNDTGRHNKVRVVARPNTPRAEPSNATSHQYNSADFPVLGATTRRRRLPTGSSTNDDHTNDKVRVVERPNTPPAGPSNTRVPRVNNDDSFPPLGTVKPSPIVAPTTAAGSPSASTATSGTSTPVTPTTANSSPVSPATASPVGNQQPLLRVQSVGATPTAPARTGGGLRSSEGQAPPAFNRVESVPQPSTPASVASPAKPGISQQDADILAAKGKAEAAQAVEKAQFDAIAAQAAENASLDARANDLGTMFAKANAESSENAFLDKRVNELENMFEDSQQDAPPKTGVEHASTPPMPTPVRVANDVAATAEEKASQYVYTSMNIPTHHQDENTICENIDATLVTNASAENEEGDPIGVQDKFEKLALGFDAIPQLIRDVKVAFAQKFKTMMLNLSSAFQSMNENVNTTVSKVQINAHDKRAEVITHFDDEGTKSQLAINALENAGMTLRKEREKAEATRQLALVEAKAAQDEKHAEVKKQLNDHNQTIGEHDGQLDGHSATLVDHTGKLNTHSHQLGLAKAAMDQDLCGGYGTDRLKGTSRDMLVNWDQNQPRKTHAQEKADAARRRLAADSTRGHTVVLEALLEEINRQN